jgi:hypothetical protein
MYVNTKMIPAETIPGMEGRDDKGEGDRGVNPNIIHLKTL